MIDAEMINSGRLTPKESEVARLMAEGHADKVIARLLAISIRTLNVHSAHIYEKLGLYSESIADNTSAINCRVAAVATLVARGMVRLSFRALVFALMIGSVQLDDAAAVRGGRLRAPSVRMRARDA